MPTPFYHLRLARELLPASPPLVQQHAAEFYLGNIAPDAQNISGQTREATHFFDVPMKDLTPASQALFRLHPGLADPAKLPASQAAFLAGYLCHLVLDQQWISDIFDPIFGLDADWSNFRRRLFIHNVLRVYLDRLDWPFLRDGVGETLCRARPDRWLPFLADSALCGWRDFVAHQLADGADTQTIAVFAKRMSLSPAEFETLLQSPPAMQTQIFDRIPLATLDDFRTRGLALSREVIQKYLDADERG
jgi:hypothetical protein